MERSKTPVATFPYIILASMSFPSSIRAMQVDFEVALSPAQSMGFYETVITMMSSILRCNQTQSFETLDAVLYIWKQNPHNFQLTPFSSCETIKKRIFMNDCPELFWRSDTRSINQYEIVIVTDFLLPSEKDSTVMRGLAEPFTQGVSHLTKRYFLRCTKDNFTLICVFSTL